MIRAGLLLAPVLVLVAVEGEPDGSVLVHLAGDLPLVASPSPFDPGRRTLHEACEDLRAAFRGAERQVLIDCSAGFAPTLAAAEELAAVIRSRQPGQHVACLIENVGDAALVVAAACDEVVVAEYGLLLVDGLALDVDHYATLLERLGVRFHAVTSGPEKTAPEPLVRDAPSPAAQAEYRKLLSAADEALVALSRRPGLDAAALRRARAAAPQLGAEAVALGLADRVVEPGAWLREAPRPQRTIGTTDVPDLSTLTGLMTFWRELMAASEPQRDDPAVAVVHLEGMIVDGDGDLADGFIAGHAAARLFDDLAETAHIKAVVVRISSGGGSASASERIHQALRRLDAVKPTIALLDSVAASGGYYVACAARAIHAHRATLTGSIGVFALMPDLAGSRDLLGIKRFSLRSDPRADLLGTNAMHDERLTAMSELVDDFDRRFQALVAERRGLGLEVVAELADGKVFLGAEAQERGLVDQLGALAGAVSAARAEAGERAPLRLEIHPAPDPFARLLAAGLQAHSGPLASLTRLQRLTRALGRAPLWAWRAPLGLH